MPGRVGVAIVVGEKMRLNKRQKIIEELMRSCLSNQDKKTILLIFKNKKIDAAVDLINNPSNISGDTIDSIAKTIDYISEKLYKLDKYKIMTKDF